MKLTIACAATAMVFSAAPDAALAAPWNNNKNNKSHNNNNNRKKPRGATDAARILGGDFAKEGDYPFFVGLRFGWPGWGPEDSQTGCGGSLIDRRWVLTAAHCLTTVEVADLKVYVHAGTVDREDFTTLPTEVAEVVMHPDYWGLSHDMALLRLREPVTLQEGKVELIKIASERLPPEAATEVMGWGKDANKKKNQGPRYLKKAILHTGTKQECWDDIVDMGKALGKKSRKLLKKEQDYYFCVGGNDEGADACYGDSGGPAVVREGGEWRLHGVTSFGGGKERACAINWTFYRDASAYLDWIEEETCIPQAVLTGAQPASDAQRQGYYAECNPQTDTDAWLDSSADADSYSYGASSYDASADNYTYSDDTYESGGVEACVLDCVAEGDKFCANYEWDDHCHEIAAECLASVCGGGGGNDYTPAADEPNDDEDNYGSPSEDFGGENNYGYGATGHGYEHQTSGDFGDIYQPASSSHGVDEPDFGPALCRTKCGKMNNKAMCFCNKECIYFGDCCRDFEESCPKQHKKAVKYSTKMGGPAHY